MVKEVTDKHKWNRSEYNLLRKELKDKKKPKDIQETFSMYAEYKMNIRPKTVPEIREATKRLKKGNIKMDETFHPWTQRQEKFIADKRLDGFTAEEITHEYYIEFGHKRSLQEVEAYLEEIGFVLETRAQHRKEIKESVLSPESIIEVKKQDVDQPITIVPVGDFFESSVLKKEEVKEMDTVEASNMNPELVNWIVAQSKLGTTDEEIKREFKKKYGITITTAQVLTVVAKHTAKTKYMKFTPEEVKFLTKHLDEKPGVAYELYKIKFPESARQYKSVASKHKELRNTMTKTDKEEAVESIPILTGYTDERLNKTLEKKRVKWVPEKRNFVMDQYNEGKHPEEIAENFWKEYDIEVTPMAIQHTIRRYKKSEFEERKTNRKPTETSELRSKKDEILLLPTPFTAMDVAKEFKVHKKTVTYGILDEMVGEGLLMKYKATVGRGGRSTWHYVPTDNNMRVKNIGNAPITETRIKEEENILTKVKKFLGL
jgi:hypothetical protein